MHSIQTLPERSQRPPARSKDRSPSYAQPQHAELTAEDAAQLRQLLVRLRRRYSLGRRRDAGGKATNRRDALVAASIMMADPGAFFDALAWSLDAQYGHVGRGGQS